MNAFDGVNTKKSTVAQMYSNFSIRISNEFIAGFNQIRDQRIVPGKITPEMSVGVVPIGGTTASGVITFGTEQFSVGNDLKQNMLELQDNVIIFQAVDGIRDVAVTGVQTFALPI